MPSQPANTISTLARTPVLNAPAGTMSFVWIRQLSLLLSSQNNLADIQSVSAALVNLGFTGGSSRVVPLAKITGGGTNGSLTIQTWENGLQTVTASVDPT